MASRRGVRAIACATGLLACGWTGNAAWQAGFWGSTVGSLLVAFLLASSTWRLASERVRMPAHKYEAREDAGQRLLLDAAPTPMLRIEGPHARALNRAARRLFATDDRLTPAPAALGRPDERYLRHEGRRYRIDRVALDSASDRHFVATLVDVEQEERVAEARATAEMLHVLGHELLNGLAPIASLAESGEAALDARVPDLDMLREILTTLSRRAEGLQRFTKGYRDLARLPEPHRTPVSPSEIASDLGRLFQSRWPDMWLDLDAPDQGPVLVDRDQLHQAVWALLQNAAEAGADQGSPRVSLSIRVTNGSLVAEVQDEGPGISAEQAARIFRPFHTTKPTGTGVGLSLARHIALAHGGSLFALHAAPTTFRLTIPLAMTL